VRLSSGFLMNWFVICSCCSAGDYIRGRGPSRNPETSVSLSHTCGAPCHIAAPCSACLTLCGPPCLCGYPDAYPLIQMTKKRVFSCHCPSSLHLYSYHDKAARCRGGDRSQGHQRHWRELFFLVVLEFELFKVSHLLSKCSTT
jgi:hypothetical protein